MSGKGQFIDHDENLLEVEAYKPLSMQLLARGMNTEEQRYEEKRKDGRWEKRRERRIYCSSARGSVRHPYTYIASIESPLLRS